MASESNLGIRIIDESYRDFFAAVRTSEMLEDAARAMESEIPNYVGSAERHMGRSSAGLRAGLHRSLEKKLKKIATPDPECISLDASLAEAGRRMRLSGIGILLLSEQDSLVGAVTDHDIIVRAVAEGLDPTTTTLRQIMT